MYLMANLSFTPCVGGHPPTPFTFVFFIAYLGFNVSEQQCGTADLQQHALTPHTALLLQELQTLHAVGQSPQLHTVQLTGEQVLRHRDTAH